MSLTNWSKDVDAVKLKRTVMAVLAKHARQKLPAPRNKTIAEIVGLDKRTIERLFIHLRNSGRIRVERFGSHDRRIFVPNIGWTAWSRPLQFAQGQQRPSYDVVLYDDEKIALAFKGRRFTDHKGREVLRRGPKGAPLTFSVSGGSL